MQKTIEFEIDQPKFAAALAAAVSVADRRSSNQPILASVLLRADVHGLSMTATDMQVSVREVLDAAAVSHGGVCIAAAHLLNVVRSLPAKPLRIKGLENHWISVKTGRSEFKLMGQGPGDFPEIPEAEKTSAWTVVPCAGLRDAIDRTMFSVSTDEARVNLNGLYVESTGQRLTAVSTDGHRLTKLAAETPFPKTDKLIIPRKGLIELRKFIDKRPGEVAMASSGPSGHLFLRSGQAHMSIKLNNVVFPPYEQVIPKNHQRRVVADRAELIAVLKRSEMMAPEKTATVKLEIAKGSLVLTADNPDLGIAREEIDVEFKNKPLTTNFNASYLIEVLAAMTTAQVALEFQGELDPCVLRPVDGPDFLGVVMPMRI
jgi:DNA polymerase-3 subunit beta